SATQPIHINIGFDEPLLAGDARPLPSSGLFTRAPREASDPESSAREIAAFLERSARPLILIGGLAGDAEREASRNFAIPLGAPIYAEPLSGLREDLDLETLVLRSGEAILHRGEFDAVLRLGSVPSIRYWRDLDEGLAIPVLSASSLPFGGLGRGAHLQCDLAKTLPLVRVAPRPNREIHRLDHALAGRTRELFEKEKRSEPALVRELSEWIPEGSLVYLGNSLPIREWDLYATRRRRFSFGANRGANGIDGQLSTFLGMAKEGRENWCLVGDLTALYDLSSPWVIPQIADSAPIRIVIINNRGGRIFSRVPSLRAVPESERERLFENPHAIGFEQWAAMWGLDYFDRLRPRRPLAPRSVIELRPEADQTSRFLEAYDALARGTP
ncbi:MAG TPA: hypothetical protein VLV48_09660, partial [Thermoanaerobaculia bacterium]|nr:hypothetical protein [Thermoanaerobaculia bacterium]